MHHACVLRTPLRSLTLTLTHAARARVPRSVADPERNMPVFRDCAGSSYEVRGVEGQFYNLFSAPRLSINAAFTVVPDAFQVFVCRSPA